MVKKRDMLSTDDAKAKRQGDAMSNAQLAAYLRNQYEVLTNDDGEIAKQVAATAKDIADIKRDYESLQQWADYERAVYAILNRDLVADAKAARLFDNMTDPSDASNHPEPPENIRDQAALLWPF